MSHDDANEASGHGDPPRRRRPRYSGTHPRRFDQRYKERAPQRYPETQAHIRAQGRTPAGTHVPVMLDEVMAALAPTPGCVVADCTLGYGGHATEFVRRIAPGGRLFGLDVDATALRTAAERLGATATETSTAQPARGGPAYTTDDGQVRLYRRHFAGLGRVLQDEGLDGFDVILADLGASSMQLDDPARGFAYKHDGPLDMRMDDRLPRTAADLVASLTSEELRDALRTLADEPDAARIADVIVERRRQEPIRRTRELVRAVLDAKGIRPAALRAQRQTARPGLHPAARTFQALRMFVNDELGGLEQFLRVVPYCLRPGGRVAVLSFHSKEDDRVLASFRELTTAGTYAAYGAEPTRPAPAEAAANPRSRSALLRWARRPLGDNRFA